MQFSHIDIDSIPGLYPWQKECLHQILDRNAIVSAPTGAGKTKVAYIWMRPADASRGIHKIFYTVPIKALANEKYFELSQLYGEKLVGIETGDVKKHTGASILVCTQEIYTKKYARRRIHARIVIDEFHYIFSDQKRSRAYIDGIRFARPEHKFLIMSATLGNVQKIREYLLRVTGKEFTVYETDYRPTELVYTDTVYAIDELPPHTIVYLFNTRAISYFARFLSSKKPPLPLLKRRKITRLGAQYKTSLEKFPEITRGIAQYHGKMTYTEKKFVEHLIREGLISTILATSALGVGVNLPVKHVIFASTLIPNGDRTYRTLSKTEFVQLSGRAGRKGYFDIGYVACLSHNFTRYEPASTIVENYRKLLNTPLEEPEIRLHIDVEKIIKGETSLDDEKEYVVKYSLPERNPEEVEAEAQKITLDLLSLSEEVRKYLADFYFPELGITGSGRVISFLLETRTKISTIRVSGAGASRVKEKVVDALKLPIEGKDEVSTLLLKRKVGKQLQKKVIDGAVITVTNIKALEEKIKHMDPLLLI